MKKILPLVAVMLATLVFQPAHAGPDDIQGSILLPTPPAGTGDSGEIGNVDCMPDEAGCHKGQFSGAHRRLWINGGDAVNGLIGYTIPISKTGTQFTLKSVPADSADFDITFYRDMGTPPNGAPDTEFGGARSTFALFGTGAEKGTVPAGAKWAIITSWAAVNATFSYTS